MTDAELAERIKTILCEKVELLTRDCHALAQEEVRKDIRVLVEVLKVIQL